MDPGKKYALIALASFGATMLLTGATGPRLLKRLQSIGKQSGDVSADAAIKTRKPLRLKELTKLSRRIKNSKATTAQGAGGFTIDPLGKDFFTTNKDLIERSEEWARQLEEQDRRFELGDENERAQESDDGFNPALFAFKAFAIATGITLTCFTAGVYALMRYYDIDDVRDLGLAFTQQVTPVLNENRPTLPTWARPSEKQTNATTSNGDGDDEEEDLSYWSQVKEALDKEAAEDDERRRKRWQALQQSKASASSQP